MAATSWRPGLFRWQLAAPADGLDELARSLRLSPLLVQILHNRGCRDGQAAEAFLNPKLTDLHDPAELPGTVEAARRIVEAVAAGKRIVIYGDFDVDGQTAVAILHACLKQLGADVHYYVPHRLEEGYGINRRAIGRLVGRGMGMLVTVDCGITAIDELAEATAAGVEVIVTDHHLPGATLPDVAAIVHPALNGSYPNPSLSGAGVAFKLAWQIARQCCKSDRVDEAWRRLLLDSTALAALGTIADVVPLLGENRALAAFGLKGLAGSEHPGLQALIRSAELGNGTIDAYDVGFRLAPRLNASGRMGHARLAIELLTDPTPQRAQQIAEYLGSQNQERQRTERAIADEAMEMVAARGLDGPGCGGIVLTSENWHAGVIGIVASRLVDRFSRPAVLIALRPDGLGQGSGRSVPGFDLRGALEACSQHLVGFGGHAMAAGLKIQPEKIDAFADAFNRIALQSVRPATGPTLAIDVQATASQLHHQAVRQMESLGPFGQGNPQPIVALRDCQLLVPPRRIGRNGNAVTLVIQQGNVSLRAVGFGMGDLADMLPAAHSVHVAGQPFLNTFNGRTSVELQLRDIKWD